VFISYGHDEYSDLAFKLEEDLKKEGIIVWIDKSELPAGKDWELRIERGLLGTQLVISMLTPHSVGRQDGFCRDELSYARTLGRKIVPIMVREVIPPLSIHRIQWLDFREWPDVSEEIYKRKFVEILDIVMGKLLSFEGEYSRLLDSLEPLDFGAEIDKHIANFYGRKWMFEIIDNWFNSDSESKVFLLTGSPGIGKTAISAMLCKKYSDCAVYHLVKYNDALKSDTLECVLSLAFQLATRIPNFAEKLLNVKLERIRKDSHLPDYAITVFDKLIVQPLSKIPTPPEKKLVIIDALDEATKDNKNELVRLIAEKFDLLPSWLKLFITTRPIKKIENSLSAFDPVRLEAEEERNFKDIEGYLKMSLTSLFGEINITDAVKVILEKSEGIFLYVQQVVEEIKKGRLKIDNLEEFPQGLKGVYQMFFERQFPNLDNYDEYQRPLLDIISAAYEPLDMELIKDILGDTNRKFKQRIEPMGSLLEIEDGVVKPFHRSLTEWVTDEKTSVEFYIDAEEGHNILLNYGWKTYKSDVTLMQHYFLIYLPHHLLVFKNQEKVTELLTDYRFIKNAFNYPSVHREQPTRLNRGIVGKVGLIFNLIKSLSEISDLQEVPIKHIRLFDMIGKSFSIDGAIDADVVSASLTSSIELSSSLITAYNGDLFKFCFIKFSNASLQTFFEGKTLQAKGKLYGINYRYRLASYAVAVVFDKWVTLEQILLNNTREINIKKEESLLKTFKDVKEIQEGMKEKFIQRRDFDKSLKISHEKITKLLMLQVLKELPLKLRVDEEISESKVFELNQILTHINTQIQLVLNNFDCIQQIIVTTVTGLKIADGLWGIDKILADIFTASSSTLLSHWKKLRYWINAFNGADRKERNIKYIITVGEKTFIIIMPIGENFFMNLFISDTLEFHRYLEEFMDCLKELKNNLQIIEDYFKKEKLI